MRRVVLVTPGLVGADTGRSLLTQRLPALQWIVPRARIWRLAPEVQRGTPELAWFGLDPSSKDLAQGPLTVAALGADPPDRSVHFHVSLLSCDADGTAAPLERPPPEAELRTITIEAARLDTRALTFIAGGAQGHGLVWESGSLDLGVTPPDAATGRPVQDCMPQGDGEPMLRRWIHDSVNVLTGLELNRQRAEEGLPPANLLWPWGPGLREPLPNLALRRGEPAWVLTGSLRAQGLARLVGYRHGVRTLLGNGFNFDPRDVFAEVLGRPLSILVLDSFARARVAGRIDEGAWLLRALDVSWFGSLLDAAHEAPVRLTLLAPSEGVGLALEYDSAVPRDNAIPFDERALEDARLTDHPLFESVAEGLR